MPRSFLLIGLSWDEFPKVAPPDQREVLEAKIKAGLETARQQFQDAGLDYKMEHYGMSDDMGKLEGWMKEKKWDGVVIGGGIRTIMLFTPLFERLVNGIQEYSPETKLVFNTTPEDTLESVRRQFPDV